jgi:hypothetical protein
MMPRRLQHTARAGRRLGAGLPAPAGAGGAAGPAGSPGRRCGRSRLRLLGLESCLAERGFRVIGQIRDSGIATLIVDRDDRRVLAQSDGALVLLKGRVVLAGDAQSLRDSPQLGALLGV